MNNRINPIIRWWVTPKLPIQDIFESHNFVSQWLIHPIRRRLARNYLKLLQKFTDITVIGITGSTGKSTTAQMLASILKKRGKTVCTLPSIDPVYNIPNAILKCSLTTKYLILEMSVEYPGEMDFYLWLAQPDIGIITNIYPTHTAFLGGVDGVAKEKGKLIASLDKSGYSVLNAENGYTKQISGLSRAKIILFGDDKGIKARDTALTKDMNTKYCLIINSGKINVLLPIPGKQFVDNSLAAAAAGHVLGASLVEIRKGVESFKVPQHRMRPIKLASGALIIDDTYNNNPKAAEASLKTFQKIAGEKKKIIVFGDMLELGSLEKSSHREVGELISELKPDYVVCVGSASKITAGVIKDRLGEERVEWVETAREAVPLLKPRLTKDAIVLIKGSRAVRLEKVVSALTR